jgi:hypothetical protein
VLALARRANPKVALAVAVVAGAALYVVALLDPYVCLLMVPFFALGCARGKHPMVLLALSLLPALALLAASEVKFRLAGTPLVVYDQYFLRQNLLILAYNDWRVATGLIVAAAAIVLYLWHLFSGRGAFSRFEKGALGALSLASVACLVGMYYDSKNILNWDAERGAPTLQTLVKSFQVPEASLRLVNTADAAPAVQDKGFGAPASLPDIFFVLQESTMPPSLLRPDHKPQTLFAPNADETGPLFVHTFAGATWRTEFSVATQMRPQEFGGDGLYVFYQLDGRIKRSIFTALKALGYRTMVFYPVAGSFINARNFYTSIGVDEFYDPESLGLNKSWNWRIPDVVFYNAMLKKIGTDGPPVVAMMLTINQHGPHDIPDPITDYVARFAQSDAAYGVFLDALAKRGRKAGVATFGDHQPEFTARFLDDDYKRYFTAYDIRCVNFQCAPGTRGDKPLDVVMLAPEALEKFGFSLDDFSTLQRGLFQDCDTDIGRCNDDTRMQFNTAFSQYFH